MRPIVFYEALPLQPDLVGLTQQDAFTPLPSDWLVGTSDIVGSTKLIADGRYKTVNMVGAAVISAQINTHKGVLFPYVFGGDGATFAIPRDRQDAAKRALQAVRSWALTEFGIALRVALVSVAEIRSAGHDVTVARYKASSYVDYAMFAGGGLRWAEGRMKSGVGLLAEPEVDQVPDLTGLSCRWSHMPSTNGTILSVIAAPTPGHEVAFGEVASTVLSLANTLDRGGHPASVEGPGTKWPPLGATLEAIAQKGAGSLRSARRKALFESLVAWILIRTGIKIGGFDARRYRRIVGENADFRKFDDGLLMTIDCDLKTMSEIENTLSRAADQGILRYGLHQQDEAMMTCIAPSIMTDDHVHFVDGAGGGYTQAAANMKAG